jgi:hypothetical protein
MADTMRILEVLRTVAAMNTTVAGPEVSKETTLEQLGIPSTAYLGVIAMVRDTLHTSERRLPPASELFTRMKLDSSMSLQEVAEQFSRVLAAAPPLCPQVDLPDPPGNEECRFWQDRSFRCRILRSIRLWSGKDSALLTDRLGDLIPGEFTRAQLVALVEMTKTQAVFDPRTYAIRVPEGIQGSSTGHHYGEAIWNQQPETTDSCHRVPYEGATA